MPDMIKDGKGTGYLAQVTNCNRVKTDSVAKNVEFVLSKDFGQMYNISNNCEISTETTNVLYIKNNDSLRNFTVSEIRSQIFGVTSDLPNINSYISLYFNPTFISSGTELTSINLKQGSGNDADVTAYSCPSLTIDTDLEAFRIYPNSNELYNLDKKNSIMLTHNDSLCITYNSPDTTGVISVSLLFGMTTC